MSLLLYFNRERHFQDIHWAKLAGFTEGALGEVEGRGACTLGNIAPYAHLVALERITARPLELQGTLRDSGTRPLTTKGKTNFNDIAIVHDNRTFRIGGLHHLSGFGIISSHHHIAGTTIGGTIRLGCSRCRGGRRCTGSSSSCCATSTTAGCQKK